MSSVKFHTWGAETVLCEQLLALKCANKSGNQNLGATVSKYCKRVSFLNRKVGQVHTNDVGLGGETIHHIQLSPSESPQEVRPTEIILYR